MRELNEAELLVYTSKARADKAINSLKGILLGINLDGEVNEHEVNELKFWAQSHSQLINRNPFREFMTIIENAISYDGVSMDVIQDLYWLCQKYEHDSIYYKTITCDLQTLQGICHGILADGVINEKEVRDLHKWLEENTHLSTYYPYDEIRSLLLSILADGAVEEEEIRILKAYLNQFVKIENEEIASQISRDVSDINISAHCTSDPHIEFDSKTFCITGVLKSGSRKKLAELISNLGGLPTETLTKKTDYLIVGDNGNPAWAFACYGRKVEKALEMRKSGHRICLIHEFDFMDAVEDLG